MRTGSRKGNTCDKRTTRVDSVKVPYCFTHVEAHRDDINPIVGAQKEKELREQLEAKEEFMKSLEPRRLDYKEIARLARVEGDIKMEDEGEPEKDLLIKKVDEICMTTILAHKIIETCGIPHRFRVFPSQYVGFDLNDIKAEFVKRGFSVSEYHDENILEVRMKYIPGF
jgi:hypothetical protein